LARRLAAEKGVDLSTISGTGPNQRVVAADVQELQSSTAIAQQPAASSSAAAAPPQAAVAATAPPAAGDFADLPLSSVRKIIADRLLESKQTIPHYYLTMDCTVDEILALRKRLNERKGADYKLSVNDFVIKAAALALKQVPEVNSSWQGTSIRQYNYVDISVAVSTDGGLITPIVKDADIKGFAAISDDVKGLAERARTNKLTPEEYVGGTFTISNLGMYGVSSFSAIINPPQAAILAVGGSKPMVMSRINSDGEKEFVEKQVMSVTLSCDHRVVDGAVGAQWLQRFKGYIEDPLTMLL
jgi:pyruvate dehydrogenase E2 component (dihydrolipoamide acetyltransferase)